MILGAAACSDGPPAAGPPAARPAAAPQSAPVPVPVQSSALAQHFSRFALNALLVPLLDDSEPPLLTDVALRFHCGPATRVEVDGRPLAPGAPMPATAFHVRWHIDQCWPLDYSDVELSGVVELSVFHEDEGLGAVVDASRLRIAGASGTAQLQAPFAAAMSMSGRINAP